MISRETPGKVHWGHWAVISFGVGSPHLVLYHSSALNTTLCKWDVDSCSWRQQTAWVVGRMPAKPPFPASLNWCFTCMISENLYITQEGKYCILISQTKMLGEAKSPDNLSPSFFLFSFSLPCIRNVSLKKKKKCIIFPWPCKNHPLLFSI